jgi:hypothetical protein
LGLFATAGAPLERAASGQATSEQNQERKTNRRVASVLRGLSGIKRERADIKGFS